MGVIIRPLPLWVPANVVAYVTDGLESVMLTGTVAVGPLSPLTVSVVDS